MGTIERYLCPEHGETLNEQQALGPYCRECQGRVDPVIVEYVPASQCDELLAFLRRFRSWVTTADLNRLAHEADELLWERNA